MWVPAHGTLPLLVYRILRGFSSRKGGFHGPPTEKSAESLQPLKFLTIPAAATSDKQ
jgi:hypothetical protein